MRGRMFLSLHFVMNGERPTKTLNKYMQRRSIITKEWYKPQEDVTRVLYELSIYLYALLLKPFPSYLTSLTDTVENV